MHKGDFMTKEILEYLSAITDEEKQILKEHEEIKKENYSSTREFVVDKAYVEDAMSKIIKRNDLKNYIL